MYQPSRRLSQLQMMNYTRFVLEKPTLWKKNCKASWGRGARPPLFATCP